jgi:enterobactin synthetase component D
VAPRDRFACVGLDLAAFVTASGERAILERTLGPSERAFLQADRDGPALRFALTVAFSAKESLFKALFPHVGCRFGFDAACVTDYAPAAGTIGLALTRSLAPRLPAGQPFTLAFATCAPSTVLTCMFVDRLGG